MKEVVKDIAKKPFRLRIPKTSVLDVVDFLTNSLSSVGGKHACQTMNDLRLKIEESNVLSYVAESAAAQGTLIVNMTSTSTSTPDNPLPLITMEDVVFYFGSV